MNRDDRTCRTTFVIATILFVTASSFGELLAPKLRVLFWSGGALDSLIYQPIRGEGIDAYICHNGAFPDGIFCDSLNYGKEAGLQLKEDWHWTRRSFIRFNSIAAGYDSLETCELWLYKFGTATNANWIQAYLVESAWEEMAITWLNAPTVNLSVASDRWTPPFPDWEGWFSLNITPIYENWAIGPNYGLQLRQQDLDSDDGQDIFSSDYLFCTLSIDTLEVSQEIDCDGENIVEICYEVSDPLIDSVFTALVVYDSTDRIHSTAISETVPGYPAPNLGWVNPGRYCFYWDLGADYPSREGCDFRVKIGAHNSTASILTVTDSFHIPDAEGVAWDGENLWVTRSWYVAPNDTHRVFRINPITHEIYPDSCITDDLFIGYTADCVWHDGYLWIMGGNLFPQRSKIFKFDVTTCSLVDSSAALWASTRWGQGIDYFEGWFYACDSNGKIYRIDPTPPYASSIWLDLETIHPGLMSGAISADAMVFALGSIWILRNPGPSGHVLLQFDYDGEVLDSFALASLTGFGPEGITFDGECFWYSDHNKNFVYRVCPWACDESLAVNACFDSKLPEIELICPEEPIYVGETAEFHWLVAELFESSEPGSLIIEDAENRYVYPVSDGSYDLEIPELCRTASFAVMIRDSFCNWGADTCYLDVCNRFTVDVECAPCGDFTSCPDQQVRYIAYDPICGDVVDSVFFTVIIFESGGDSTVYHPVAPSPTATLEFIADSTRIALSGIPYSDGDSVWVGLDSLVSIRGCRTYP